MLIKWNTVSPYFCLLGRQTVRKAVGNAGMGLRKKRMPLCNEVDRGSKFAPPERGADFRMVLNYERIYRIFERSKANGHENVCGF